MYTKIIFAFLIISFGITFYSTAHAENPKSYEIPSWIKNNADWWANGQIEDYDFIQGLQFLINEQVLVIPPTLVDRTLTEQPIPDWIKTSVGWWSQDLTSDVEFIDNIQFLIKKGIIVVQESTLIEDENEQLFLSIAGMESDDPQQFLDGKEQVGANSVLVPVAWDAVEIAKEEYTYKELSRVKEFYTKQGTKVVLGINPIDTNNLRVPADLKDNRFNDEEMINRYNKMMTSILENTDSNNILAINIGNEIDEYLDESSWLDYIEFYKHTSKHVKQINPGIKVGSKVTFGGFFAHENEVKELNQYSDVVMVTYYPLNGDFTFKDPSVIEPEFSYLMPMIDKPVYVMEIGYASGERVGSIDQQKQFVINAFKTWDANPSIRLMSFVWMDDVPESMKEVFSTYYGFSNENFIEFLSTLGLRYEDKSPKDAWNSLIEETRTRGWHK